MISNLDGYNNGLTFFSNAKADTLKSNMKRTERSSEGKSFSTYLKESMKPNEKVKKENLTAQGKKLHGQCVEMESLLWKQVLNSMKKTVGKYKLIDGGQGEKIFKDFLYDEYAMLMAKKSNTGLSETIFKDLAGIK